MAPKRSPKSTVFLELRPIVAVLVCFVVSGCAPGRPTAPSPSGLPTAVQGGISADPRVAWLKAHAIPIRSVDPADVDYSDLRPLEKLIGASRMVFLGEQTHDDGATFLAKTRIIKFLHQEMGFDVLVWESGLYDVAKAWELIEAGENPAKAIRRAIFPAWSDIEETRALFEYIGETARSTRPLEIAGFDCQISGTVSRDFLVPDLRAFLQDIGLDAAILDAGTPLAAGLGAMVGNISAGSAAKIIAPDSVFVTALGELQQRIVSAAAPRTSTRQAFWIQLLGSLGQEALKLQAQLRSHDVSASKEERDAAFRSQWNLRDTQMAKNLLWLAKEHQRSRKIIGWLATAHAVRNPDEVDPRMPNNPRRGTTTIGHLIWKALGQELYVLGFTSYNLAAFEQAPKSDQSEEVEFEELMRATNFEYAVVDFRQPFRGGEWLHKPIISRPMANYGMKAIWPKILDGMFYIKDWKPATKAGR